MALPRLGGKEIDGAAHGQVAEDAGGSASRNLHARQIFRREPGPVHPTSERIVEGNAIKQDQSAGSAGRSDSAQRNALRRGIRDLARCPAEQAEARHLAKTVVQLDARRVAQLIAGNGCNIGWRFGGDMLIHRDGRPNRGQRWSASGRCGGCVGRHGGRRSGCRHLSGRRAGKRQGKRDESAKGSFRKNQDNLATYFKRQPAPGLRALPCPVSIRRSPTFPAR